MLHKYALTVAALVWSVAPCLAQSRTFGASVAVGFDGQGHHSIHVAGDADPFAGRGLTAEDPVRIASISKLVVALGVMRLTEAGALDLDRDVSDVLGWRLRNPAFPDAPITLRQLLSHQSSLTDGAEYLIPAGQSLRAFLADGKAWDTAHPPGTYFRYANLNFPVIASIMERTTGERFDRLMTRLVFRPLRLDACFNWSGCSASRVARAVVLTDGAGNVRRDRINGKPPDCLVYTLEGASCDMTAYAPGENGGLYSPQGGLRISARDLARIGQVLAGRKHGFLKRVTLKRMISPQWHFDGRNGETESGFFCRYGLGVQTLATQQPGCRDDPFGDGLARIGHAGEAYGLRSGLWVEPRDGRGIAFFLTAVADDAPKGRSAFTAAEEALLQNERHQPHR
jgi:CubicO group peptidase (beta-lactamase class C family)